MNGQTTSQSTLTYRRARNHEPSTIRTMPNRIPGAALHASWVEGAGGVVHWGASPGPGAAASRGRGTQPAGGSGTMIIITM